MAEKKTTKNPKNNWAEAGTSEEAAMYGGSLHYVNKTKGARFKAREIVLDFDSPNKGTIYYMRAVNQNRVDYSKKFKVKLKPATWKKLRRKFNY